MSLELNHPWALAALLALPWMLWRARRSLAGLDGAPGWLSLALRALLLVAAVLALAGPRASWPAHRPALITLVDASLSNAGAAEEFFRAHRAEFERPFAEAATFAFAGGALPWPADADGPAQPPRADASDLGGALRLALAALPEGTVGTVVVVGDGHYGPGWEGPAAALAAAGVPVHAWPLAPPPRPEVLLRSLTAPPAGGENEGAEVVATIAGTAVAGVRVSLFREGARVGVRELFLRPGEPAAARFAVNLGTGRFARFRAVVEPLVPGGDTLAENNALAAVTRLDGEARVLLLTDRPESARALALALRAQGLRLDVRGAEGLPAAPGELLSFAAVILDNLPADAFREAQLNALSAWVRELGGGLLMLGGERTFGLGGYGRSPLGPLLPVESDFERERDEPALALALVIDRSGSMTGEKLEMAKEAARASVELLSPRDYAGVVAFDSEAAWAAPLAAVADPGAFAAALAGLQPGGGTAIAPALRLALPELAASAASLKHLILLTDGQSQPGPFRELVGQLSQAGVTVSTVALGQGADVNLLADLAQQGGGRTYFTAEASAVPRIFARETMTATRSSLREDPFLPVAARRAPFLAGIDLAGAPLLLGYVQTRPRAGADLWLQTERGEPLLASWPVGVGRVGAFTSDARNRWAVEWLRWDGYGLFWGQVVRHLQRPESLAAFPARLKADTAGYALEVETVDDAGRLRTDLAGEVRWLAGAESRPPAPLAVAGPGLLRARLAANAPEALAEFSLRGPQGREEGRAVLAAVRGYPAEYLHQGLDETTLRALAAATGGRFRPGFEGLAPDPARTAPRWHDLWPWLTLAALLLLIADVGVRRWPWAPR